MSDGWRIIAELVEVGAVVEVRKDDHEDWIVKIWHHGRHGVGTGQTLFSSAIMAINAALKSGFF